MDGKKREKSNSAPKLARMDNTSPAIHVPKALNTAADSFISVRDRISVHLAAGCDWTNDQVLAADAEQRHAHTRAHHQVRSPGAGFSEVELGALATGQLPVDLQAAAPIHAKPEAPLVNLKRKRVPQQQYGKPKSSKAAAPAVETAPAQRSKRPEVLRNRAVEQAAAKASTATPRIFSIKHFGKHYTKHQGDGQRHPIKVNQAYFDATPLDQRHMLEVIYASDSDNTGGSRVDVSSDAPGPSDDDDQSGDGPRAAPPKAPSPPPLSRWDSDLEYAIKVLMIVGDMSQQAAKAIMKRHADAHGHVSPLGAPLRSAYQELKASAATAAAAAPADAPLSNNSHSIRAHFLFYMCRYSSGQDQVRRFYRTTTHLEMERMWYDMEALGVDVDI